MDHYPDFLKGQKAHKAHVLCIDNEAQAYKLEENMNVPLVAEKNTV